MDRQLFQLHVGSCVPRSKNLTRNRHYSARSEEITRQSLDGNQLIWGAISRRSPFFELVAHVLQDLGANRKNLFLLRQLQ